jgi:Domain of unknown function (DUF1906)
MSSGIDANRSVVGILPHLKTDGIEWVGRYYNANSPAKNLTAEEAKAISAAGLSIVSVWENGYPTEKGYFTYAQGGRDAKRAVALAQLVGQTKHTPIYFAVDYDASGVEARGIVNDYFSGISDWFCNYWVPYAIGVYGSGLTCRCLTARRMASYAWLAYAPGWAEEGYEGWNIKQLKGDGKYGMDIDYGITKGNGGGWQVAHG